MAKYTKQEALSLMRNTPWSFYYTTGNKNGTDQDKFFYNNHKVIDKIGSDIRCFNIDMGWDGVDKYDYTEIDNLLWAKNSGLKLKQS